MEEKVFLKKKVKKVENRVKVARRVQKASSRNSRNRIRDDPKEQCKLSKRSSKEF